MPLTAGTELLPGLQVASVDGGNPADGPIAVRIDQRMLRLELVAGVGEPGHGPWRSGSEIPLDARGAVVAAFNGGFKMKDAHGGFEAEHRVVFPLVAGAASVVVYGDGTANVGAWGTEVHDGPDVVAVRQNLLPLVDAGQPAPHLDQNIIARWGVSFHPQLPTRVWRSGLGIDASGHLIYVAGTDLDPARLAHLLLRAGCARALQLDINHKFVSFNTFAHPGGPPGTIAGNRLLSTMFRGPARYLVPENRDFFALFRR